MLRRTCLLCLLVVVAMSGCSRKGDETLPERLGDMQVNFMLVQAPVLEGKPVTVEINVYPSVGQERGQLMRQATVPTFVDSLTSYSFTGLGVGLYLVEIIVKAPEVNDFPCPTDLSAIVQENKLTPTKLFEIRYANRECI